MSIKILRILEKSIDILRKLEYDTDKFQESKKEVRKMDGATKQISEYIRKKGFNLSKISRKTGVPYMALYDSLSNDKRDRDLRVDEFLALCKHLEIDPMEFYPADKVG